MTRFTRLILFLILVTAMLGCASPEKHRKKGDIFFEQQAYAQALTEYSQTKNVYLTNRDFQMKCARIYWELNKLPECKQALDRVLQLKSDDLEALRLLAMVYSLARKNDELVPLYLKIIELDPKDPIAYNNLGILYQKNRKFDLAMEKFSQALSVNDEYPDAYLNLGNLFTQEMKDDATAYYYYSQFMKLAPTSNLAADVKSWLHEYDLVNTGENKKAISLGNYFQGEKYLQKAEFEKALAEFKRALAVYSEARYYFKCGFVEKELGLYGDAVTHLKEAIRLDATNTDYLYQLGWVYKLKGETDLARAQWEHVLRLDAEHQKARKALSVLQ
jgi:tetratricopeptide (TPR) repeat protein